MSNYFDFYAPHIKHHRLNSDGQLTGLCPFHQDKRNSFGVNTKNGLWICYAGCGEGNAYQFAKQLNVAPPYSNETYTVKTKPVDQSYLGKRDKFHQYFMDNFDKCNVYEWARSICEKTKTGFDVNKNTFTFPITDVDGNLINLRWHKGPQVAGVSGSHWFPMKMLTDATSNSFVVWCEGEKDTLTLLSKGIPAITNTNGVGNMPDDITPLTQFERIYLCFDPDLAGIKGSRKVLNKLRFLIPNSTIMVCQMPGMDVTDWFYES